jgi:hypothetical protein
MGGKTIEEQLKEHGASAFSFTEIKSELLGEPKVASVPDSLTFAGLYKYSGINFAQFGVNAISTFFRPANAAYEIAWYKPTLPVQIGDDWNHWRSTKLFTTSMGCNLPVPDAQNRMTCVRFARTSYPNTPYGPLLRTHNCSEKVKSDWSGYCECQAPNGNVILHAPTSQSYSPIGHEYTCEKECLTPTWIPAITEAQVSYNTQDITMFWERFTIRNTCPEDFRDIQYMPSTVETGYPTWMSLNTGLNVFNEKGRTEESPSKLCIKR